MSTVLEQELSLVADYSNCDVWVKLFGKSFHSVCHMFEGMLCSKYFSYFNIIYHHKIPGQIQLKEICINTTHTCWTKFKNVNKILNKLFITSCYSKWGKNLMWLVIVPNAIPIHYPALMVLKIHKSDNIITLATETWNQQSNLLLFGMFMTYSTSYCHFDELTDPWNREGGRVCVHVCVFVSNTTCLIKCCH